MILVGNKSDLEKEREVPIGVGVKSAQTLGNLPFFETSAKNGSNVEKIFESIVMKMKEEREMDLKIPSKRKKKKKCVLF